MTDFLPENSRVIELESPLKTIPFSEFLTLVGQVEQRFGPDLPYTDGYVFGSTSSTIGSDFIDTTVPGGDSSYHGTRLTAGTPVRITPRGFQIENEDGEWIQFIFLDALEIPENIKTLSDVALLQAADHLVMIVEDDGMDLAGSTAFVFHPTPEGIIVHLLLHYLDPEPNSSPIDPAIPVERITTRSIRVNAEMDDGGYTSGAGILRFLGPKPGVWATLL